MAREPSVRETDSSAEPAGRSDGLLRRRSYLHLAGTVAAGAAFAGATSAAEDDYDVLEAAGQVIRIGSGETFENTLIDLTTGGSVVLLVEGGDSAIRNVGFEGLHRGEDFMISIAASSGDVLIENVYLGDGSTKEGAGHVHGPGAVFYHPDAACDVTFRRCNVQGYPNNGFYCSNTASGGSVRFERCFGKNNGVSTFRCAGGDDEIVDCVAYNDDTDYGPGYGGFSETSGRPVWVWNGGEVAIRNSEFAAGPYPYAVVAGANGGAGATAIEGGALEGEVRRAHGSRVSVGDDVSSDPDLSIPEGVPTSAAEAAADTGGSGQATSSGADGADETVEDDDGRVLRVAGTDEDATRYEFAVDGDVRGANADVEAVWKPVGEDGVVRGVVGPWTETFRLGGDVEWATVDGPGTASLDGETIDPDDYGESLPHVLEVEGRGTPTGFEVTVDGTIELASADGADEVTTVSGTTVQSTVSESTLRFRFSGSLTDVTFTDCPATVRLDGEEIDPTAVGSGERFPHALVIDGTGLEESNAYSIRVDGSVAEIDYRSRPDGTAPVRGGTVEGTVENSVEAYWFDGEVVATWVDGDADVDVQLNARNQ